MPTPYLDIYSLQEVLKNDNRLNNKTSNKLYFLYNTYLNYALGLFTPYCYKDLTDVIKFKEVIYEFKADGLSNDFLLTNPSVPLDSGLFYVGYKNSNETTYIEIEPSDYSYNSTNNVLSINLNIFVENTNIYISSYIIGSFNSDLNTTEKNILAEGMIIPYLKEMRNRNALLTQMVYGGNQKLYSQSAHIDSVNDTVTNQERLVNNMIIRYSYSQNPNKLMGLGSNNA